MDANTAIMTGFDVLKVPVAAGIGRTLLTKYERPLLEAFPFFRHLHCIRLNRLERAVHSLQVRVKDIELATDELRINGFVDIFVRYLECAAKEHRATKVKILASACAHVADANNKDSFDTVVDIWDAIERLQPIHVEVLKYLEEHHTQPDAKMGHTHLLTAKFCNLTSTVAFPESVTDHWKVRVLMQLRDLGLISLSSDSVFTINRDGEGVVESSPFVLFQNIPFGLSIFGCALLRYVQRAESESDAS